MTITSHKSSRSHLSTFFLQATTAYSACLGQRDQVLATQTCLVQLVRALPETFRTRDIRDLRPYSSTWCGDPESCKPRIRSQKREAYHQGRILPAQDVGLVR